MEIRIIICGSRKFNDYEFLKEKVTDIISIIREKTEELKGIHLDKDTPIRIISGRAAGADTLGEKYAKEFGYELSLFPAEWDRYGKYAGLMRNGDMAKFACEYDNFPVIIGFKCGPSHGTTHMLSLGNKYGFPWVLHFDYVEKEEVPFYDK